MQNWFLVSGNCMKKIILKFLCLVIFCSTVFANEQEVLRLKKGEYQYYYLTGNYMEAMNRLTQLKEKGGVSEQETNLMEVSMLLSMGLYKQAQELFETIQGSENTNDITLSNYWFILAKRWFELAEYESVIYSIDQIKVTTEQSDEFGADRIEEARFMKATSYIELGQHRKAQEVISQMSQYGIWVGYARHNYLLAMFEGNNSGRSLSLLIHEAEYYLPKTDEGRHLKDRINLIAALQFFNNGNNNEVEKYLKRISLDGPYTPAALLQLGWNFVEQARYDSALQPWRELQTRFNDFEPDVMESMLGVPHVLEVMGAHTQALKTFEMAEEKFSAMKQAVDEANNTTAINNWLDDWILNQAKEGWTFQTDLEKTFSMTETTGFLHGLISSDEFVNNLVEYRDLVLLTDYLTEQESKLQLWLELVEKRAKQSKVKEGTEILDRATRELFVAKARLSNLQEYLSQSHTDLFTLPSVVEQEKITALSDTAKVIKQLEQDNKASRNLEPYKQRWRRVRGVFLWQMNEAKPRKQWQLKKELMVTDRLIERAETQLLETRLANEWSPIAWQGMKGRVTALAIKISELKASAEKRKISRKQWLILVSEAYLNDLEYRINDYLAHTKLSIARLYDDALQSYVASDERFEKGQ